MSGYDEFLNESNRILDETLLIKRHTANLDRIEAAAQAELQEARNMNAANLGKLASALSQLEKLDPTNPLVRDQDLRVRIGRLAADAFEKSYDWDVAREVGRTFRIPGRD